MCLALHFIWILAVLLQVSCTSIVQIANMMMMIMGITTTTIIIIIIIIINIVIINLFLTLSQRQIIDSSKLKEYAEDNLEFDVNGRKFPRWVENTVGKEILLVKPVFKRLFLQTRKKPWLVYETVNMGRECKNLSFFSIYWNFVSS